MGEQTPGKAEGLPDLAAVHVCEFRTTRRGLGSRRRGRNQPVVVRPICRGFGGGGN